MSNLKNFFQENWIILALTLLAAIIRLYRLQDFPPGLHGDEALTGLDALRILKEGWIGSYVGSALGQPSGPLYWVALIFKIFGVNLFTLRASLALLGILSIPALYFLAKMLFSRQVAILASFFLTFSYWHLHFSRTAFMLTATPFMEILTLVFLVRALSAHSYFYWLISGLFAGLGIYTYNTYPVFLVAIAFILLFIFWREQEKRRFFVALLIFSGSLLLTMLPLIKFARNPQNGYWNHFKLVSIFRDARYQNLEGSGAKLLFWTRERLPSVLVFNRPARIDYVDSLGGQALLDPLTGIFLLVGILMALRKFKDQRFLLLLIGFLTAFVPLLLSSGGESRRVITALPFVFLLVALPAAKLWTKSLGRIIILGICLMVLGYNLNYYFNDFVKKTTTRWIFCYDLVKVIEHLKSFPPNSTHVYFYSARWSYNYETRRFLLPNLSGEDRSREFGQLSFVRQHPQDVVYLLMPPYESFLDEIRQLNPGGHSQKFYDEDGRLIFASYYVR